eukprot:TRINITY_DN1033_c0_g1_i2.p1 TRINITY_DN1033_c0_g1~~TRINITY_DN1033_c0_g1_i2.p1  ORF type:complete len:710 (-),score=79.81 TRINITY_DN1033_c0_g1_i2:3-2132(-)
MIRGLPLRRRAINANVIHELSAVRLGARRHRDLLQIPSCILSRVEDSKRGLWEMIAQLAEHCRAEKWDGINTVLGRISKRTQQLDHLDDNAENRAAIVTLGGTEVLLKILMLPRPKAELVPVGIYVSALQDAMTVLQHLCSDQSVVDTLLQTKWIVHIFSLLRGKTFEAAISLLEEVLAASDSCFDLSNIPNFNALTMGMKPRHFAPFCRVLSLVVFDNSKVPQGSGKVEQLLRPPPHIVNPVDRNHAILVNAPCFLSRFLTLLHLPPHVSLLPRQMAQLRVISLLSAVDERDDAWDTLRLDGQAVVAGTGSESQQLRILQLSHHLVEVMFVLSSLLSGKRKLDVRAMLFRHDIIGLLSVMFDRLDWTTPPARDPHSQPLHGPGCECNPVSQLRVQFLRVLNSVCDADFYSLAAKTTKLLRQRQLLEGIPTRADIECPNVVAVDLLRESGLIKKVANAYMRQSRESPFHFWMSSCLEAFLRSSDVTDQIELIEMGLLDHVVDEILCDFIDKNVRQSHLDLLSELIKFNGPVIHELEVVLERKSNADKFLQTLRNHLVDSNVLIRSLLLSFDFLPPEQTPLNGVLCRFLVDQRLQLLVDLMSVVTISSLAQENICCINTALLFFVSARRSGHLAGLVTQLRSDTDTSSRLTEFVRLLHFWRHYYMHRGRDSASIEYSSTIRFSEWREVVLQLCDEISVPGPILPSLNNVF